MISGQDGSGTNIDGGQLALVGGAPTGTGAVGYVRVGDNFGTVPGMTMSRLSLFVEGNLEVDGMVKFDNSVSQTAGTFSTGPGAVSLNGNTTVASGMLLTLGGHVKSTGPAIGATVGGTCTSSTVTGTDTRGAITGTCAAGATLIVTFGSSYGTAPICTISPANVAAKDGAAWVTSDATSMTVTSTAAASAGIWNYICIE